MSFESICSSDELIVMKVEVEIDEVEVFCSGKDLTAV